MAFAGYIDIADCIAQNQNKSSPEGFCSFLHHRVTGAWPGEKAQMGAFELKTISGVEIFAAGQHNGDKYTEADLEHMVDAFYQLKGKLDPPLKIGHTSGDFNRQVAAALGVPAEVVSGDGGKGAMALGWMSELRKKGDVLVADFREVPVAITQLIESGAYKKVSVELSHNYEADGKKYPFAITALALLGAEEPAVKGIKGTESAIVFERRDKSMGLSEKVKAFVDGIKGDIGQAAADPLANIKGALALPPEASEEDCLKAIKGMMDGMAELKKATAPANLSQVKEFSDLKSAFEATKQELSNERKAARVAYFTAEMSKLKNVEGKAETIGGELAELEAVNKPAAGNQLRLYQALDKAQAGLTKSTGTSQDGTSGEKPHEFEVKVRTYAAEHKIEEPTAWAILATEKPKEFAAYRLAVGQ